MVHFFFVIFLRFPPPLLLLLLPVNIFILAFPLSESKAECIYHLTSCSRCQFIFVFHFHFSSHFHLTFISLNLSSQPTNQCHITHHRASSSSSIPPFKVQLQLPFHFHFSFHSPTQISHFPILVQLFLTPILFGFFLVSVICNTVYI